MVDQRPGGPPSMNSKDFSSQFPSTSDQTQHGFNDTDFNTASWPFSYELFSGLSTGLTFTEQTEFLGEWIPPVSYVCFYYTGALSTRSSLTSILYLTHYLLHRTRIRHMQLQMPTLGQSIKRHNRWTNIRILQTCKLTVFILSNPKQLCPPI
jgi:hypothetical protein